MTASPVEVLWTLTALGGLYYVGWRLLRRALGDLRHRERSGANGVLLRLAVARVRHFWTYAAILGGYAVIGALAALDAAPPVLVLAVLLGSEALMVLDAWQEDKTNRAVLRDGHGD